MPRLGSSGWWGEDEAVSVLGLGHSDTRLSPTMQRAVRIPPSSRKQ